MSENKFNTRDTIKSKFSKHVKKTNLKQLKLKDTHYTT